MDDLIEALTIFRKYANEKWPTHCEHDVMYVILPDPHAVSEEDTKRLGELEFFLEEDEGGEETWLSFRFGKA